MRVLIIEDEARLARNVARVLAEETSCAVDTSADGEDGLKLETYRNLKEKGAFSVTDSLALGVKATP